MMIISIYVRQNNMQLIMRKNTYFIYPAPALVRYADRRWLESLKRSDTNLPKGWKMWEWQWVRPEHAWLSKRGWVCFKPEWLPAGTERLEIVDWPLPDLIEYEESSCIIEGCPC
jgi:hypothetical protein